MFRMKVRDLESEVHHKTSQMRSPIQLKYSSQGSWAVSLFYSWWLYCKNRNQIVLSLDAYIDYAGQKIYLIM